MYFVKSANPHIVKTNGARAVGKRTFS